MSKIINSKFKLSRRVGKTIHEHPSDAINYRNYFPGQHGQTVMRKKSEYATQLIAKQTIKFHHNITEKQLRNYYIKAQNKKGDTAENLICYLNSRLDICIFRSNITSTFYAASQLVSHGHVLVNGKKVNIRSYQLKVNDVVTITEKAKNMSIVKESIEKKSRRVPDYLSSENDGYSFIFKKAPSISEVPYPFKAEPNLIIELYSR